MVHQRQDCEQRQGRAPGRQRHRQQARGAETEPVPAEHYLQVSGQQHQTHAAHRENTPARAVL